MTEALSTIQRAFSIHSNIRHKDKHTIATANPPSLDCRRLQVAQSAENKLQNPTPNGFNLAANTLIWTNNDILHCIYMYN